MDSSKGLVLQLRLIGQKDHRQFVHLIEPFSSTISLRSTSLLHLGHTKATDGILCSISYDFIGDIIDFLKTICI